MEKKQKVKKGDFTKKFLDFDKSFMKHDETLYCCLKCKL
jgi:hypothetical protein